MHLILQLFLIISILVTEINFSRFIFLKAISKNDIPPPFSLAPHLTTINSCFAPNDVEEIFRKLSSDKSPFAQQQLEILKKMSPLSMKITRHQLKNAASHDIYECLNTDFRIAARLLLRSEFFEGGHNFTLIFKD